MVVSEGQIVLSGEQIVRTEEMAPAESTDMKKDQDEQGTANASHMMVD